MATTQNGIYYNSDYNAVADILEDEKKIAESVDEQLAYKVEKVQGKGLSSNDFTNEDKTKLDSITHAKMTSWDNKQDQLTAGENITIENNVISASEGVSPTATVTQTVDGATITITDKNGTTTANVSNGTNGANGQGVPTGGTAGQVLAKINGTDYNTEWITPSSGGGIGIHTDEYTSGYSTFVAHTYFYGNNKSNDGSFDSIFFQDIIEQSYNDTIAHLDTTVTENLINIYFVNSKSNDILTIRVDSNSLTGQQYGVYYQYAKEGIMYSQVVFTATLTGGKYVMSNVQYRDYTRNLIALGTQNTTSYTPTADYHPATKKYVDDIVGNINTALEAIINGGGN